MAWKKRSYRGCQPPTKDRGIIKFHEVIHGMAQTENSTEVQRGFRPARFHCVKTSEVIAGPNTYILYNTIIEIEYFGYL